VANSWDPALGEEIGKALGEETASYSVNVILGPGLNTKRSPLCGRDFEYFSEDPYLSGKLAAGYVRGIQSVGVSACPKHFAANNQELRRMASNSVLDERTLRELYLTGFEIAVKEGRPKCIMTSYNRVNGTYANENHHLLQDILHGEWGYDGAVVTDWGGSNDHVEGVREGSTLEMPCPGFGSAKRLMQAVAEGRLPESAVDARVDELLELVFTTDAAVKAAPKRFDRDAHHALARRAAAESVVLLKNEDDLLPLKPGQSVALIGDFAQTPRYQGAGSSSVNATRVDNLKDAAEADDITLAGFCAGYERSGTPNPAFVEEAAALARKADVAVLCMGLDESSESEGLDRSHICIPENQKQLLEAVAQANENLVVVLSAGSVVETGWVSRCKAVLHAYLGGQAGAGAIMDVLTGRMNPSGKLAETLPLTYEDTPAARYFPGKQQNVEYREGLYIGYRYYETAHVPVRYPFGYGLSYTTFAYSDLKADADKVTFTITNTGSRAGAEIAQLYVAKADAAVFRPEKELKGFAKVFLQAGECKTVTIPLDDKAFRYWNVKTDRWETEGGSYQLLVGASVQDIRLRAEVPVQGTGAPDPYAGKAVQCYRTADIKNVPDAAFEALLGHAIPEDKPHIDQTMTLGELNHSRSPLCWLAWAVLHTLLKRSSREGTPDLNLLFQYNMPVRALAQMTGGMVGQETVDGIVMEAKGFWIIGLLRALIGFGQNAVSNRKFRAALEAERGGPAV
jgi:beta-glucosidase